MVKEILPLNLLRLIASGDRTLISLTINLYQNINFFNRINIDDEFRVAVAEAILREQGMERTCDIFKQLYSAKRLFPQWQELVCIKSGFGILLDKYWTVAIDMFQSFIIVHGKWEEPRVIKGRPNPNHHFNH